jgi:tRNA threonylcarbamoyladenosine biosynthesis protein TsaB
MTASITLQFAMLTLALDTSSAAGSAAIVRDDRLVIEREGDGSRPHGQRLPRELMTLLDAAQITLADVDLFAVAIGPGSFTGLRLGIATIQGLALTSGKRVVPVSTFEAFRLASHLGPRTSDAGDRASTTKPLTGVWIDAHRGEVFAALYDADGAVVHEPTSLAPAPTLETWTAAIGHRRVVFAGDGAVKYRDAISARLGDTAEIPAAVPLLAGGIGWIALREPFRAVRPHGVAPLYVRRSDVELARDRRRPVTDA